MRLVLAWMAVGVAIMGCTSDPLPMLDASQRDAAIATCARDSDCDDGRWCTGTERCMPGDAGADSHGCRAGVSPCTTGMVCDETEDRCRDDCADADGDGAADAACGGTDCDDTDAQRYPGHLEICDAIDQDCDPTTLGYRDMDHDGLTASACCNPTATTPVCGDDCDDTSSLVGAGATEVCDMRDNDCNGMVDDATGAVDWYPDGDGDGFGDPAGAPISSCMIVEGRVPNHGDCDDTRTRRSPGAPEVCDGIDNDCDAMVDESALPLPWFIDFDGDGFGDSEDVPLASCAPVPGRSLDPTDCDDEDASRNPGQAEVCDARDNDCDLAVDENVPELTFYADTDGDGFGTSSDAIMACRADATHAALNPGDCDDTMPLVNPRGVEVCNAIDDDCNRIVDGSCFADVVLTPMVLQSGSSPHIVACDTNEVLVGVRYDTTRYCDLGCSPFYQVALSGICARELMLGSPSPPVSYAFDAYGEHVVGTGATELRCPDGNVLTGLGVADSAGGLTISCRPTTGSFPSSVTFGASNLHDVAPRVPTVECPSSARALTAFDYMSDVIDRSISGLRLRTCAALSLSTAIP